MSNRKHRMALTDDERDEVSRAFGAGTAPARTLRHPRMLRTADVGVTAAGRAAALAVRPRTARWVRGRVAEKGVASAPERTHPTRPKPHCLDGRAEARRLARKVVLHHTTECGS